jgi:hypothetical protein
VDFLLGGRDVGWGYGAAPNETALTGACLVALDAAREAGLRVDPAALEGARQWFDHMTDRQTGRVGYVDGYRAGAWRPKELLTRFPPEKSEALTALGIACRVALGEDPKASDLIRKGAQLLAARPPSWNPDDGSIDMIYWHFGVRALRHVGGQPWATWRKAVQALARCQHAEGSGSRTGSFDPIGAWGRELGRVGATALMTMCLSDVDG